MSRLLPLIVVLALGVPAGFLGARMIRIPLVEKLETYRPSIITRLYDRNGRVFSDYAIQRRIVVPLREMAPSLVHAIISVEDSNFYEHGGIDPKAILRAAIKDAIARKKVEGASTLTQQLAKQLFLTPEKSFRRKFNEAFLAVEIEKNFTKDQILELYANQVYLGHGAYGVEAASRTYFGKHAKDLVPAEAATLAALIQRPEYFSPISHPGRVLARRNYVLRRMEELGYLKKPDFERAVNTPIVLGSYKSETPEVGAYFSEEVRQYIEKRYGAEDLYQSGLQVHTTLDVQMQQAAEESLQEGLRRWDHRRGFRKPDRNVIKEGLDPLSWKDPAWERNLTEGKLYPAVVLEADDEKVVVRISDQTLTLGEKSWDWTHKKSLGGVLSRGDVVRVRYQTDPKKNSREWSIDQVPLVQGAIVVLDVRSGEVRALVGGYDFDISKFDRGIQSMRQTGSSFKPFVYGAAFEKGFTPADTVFDAPVEIPWNNSVYSPRNYHGEYSGIVTIQRALELSINVPAVKTLMMIGGRNVIDFARKCGITSPLPDYPSLALGAGGISPLEMTAAYNTFANQGVYTKPRFIRKITAANDKVLEESYPEISEAMSAQNAYLLTYVLEGTIRRGTGYDAHVIPGALAGKTGTTNAYTDAWFVGFSPEISVGVWVGYDDPARSLGGGATGAAVALPIWIDFFNRIDAEKLRGAPKENFDMPPGIVVVPMDLKTGHLGEGPCGRVVDEAFIAGTEPEKDCSGQLQEVIKLPYYLQRPFYEPKESEPIVAAPDQEAKPGEGAESPVPPPPEQTTTAPAPTTTSPPPPE